MGARIMVSYRWSVVCSHRECMRCRNARPLGVFRCREEPSVVRLQAGISVAAAAMASCLPKVNVAVWAWSMEQEHDVANAR